MGRKDNIDILKAICTFFVVCIHASFPGVIGDYFIALTRIAVPIFFMITGYFYSDKVEKSIEWRQIKKVFILILEANLIFFLWDICCSIILGEGVRSFFRSTFTVKNLIKFLILNESPLAGHLWYLNAILYVLLIILMTDKFECRKLLYFLTPAFLLFDLLLGKYAIIVFHREFPYIIVRNFLFVGIPYFCIGCMIRERKKVSVNKNILSYLICLFALTSLLERFVLVSRQMNAIRDHYFSTTILAVVVFIYTQQERRDIEQPWYKATATIGRKYSTWLYIIHPIFLTVFNMVVKKIGVYEIYKVIAPIVVYIATLCFLMILEWLKNKNEGGIKCWFF